jgi:4-hydroxybenzoate polyprenyltransferase
MKDQKVDDRQSLFQVLSLDVVLGALAVGAFAVKLLDVKPNPVWFFVLAGSVWVVYTVDHLLDGIRLKGENRIFRHWFHYKYRKKIILAVIAVSSVTILLAITFLDEQILLRGVYLSLFVLIYFGLHYLAGKKNTAYFQKEMIIALVYITGIFLAPLVWFGSFPDKPILIIIAALFLLAWSDSILISYFDYDNDLADGMKSFTTTYGKKATRTFLVVMLSGLVLSLSFWIVSSPGTPVRSAGTILLVMGLVLLQMIIYDKYYQKGSLYRWFGELAFLLPALIWLI